MKELWGRKWSNHLALKFISLDFTWYYMYEDYIVTYIVVQSLEILKPFLSFGFFHNSLDRFPIPGSDFFSIEFL